MKLHPWDYRTLYRTCCQEGCVKIGGLEGGQDSARGGQGPCVSSCPDKQSGSRFAGKTLKYGGVR